MRTNRFRLGSLVAGTGSYYRTWFAHGLNRVARKMRLRSQLRAIDYHLDETADLVVFSSGGNDFPIEPVRLCQQRGQRYVLIIHSVSEATWPPDDQLDNMQQIYAGAEAAFFVSHANRTSTALQLGFDSDKFEVVINPFNVDWDVPVTWPAVSAVHQWAFVGRLEPGHKGVDLLLRAFARERWQRRNVQINFYGGGISERSVKGMAQMLGMGSRVCFHGQVGDLESIWRKNELLIAPSRHEGLPLVVVEAMLYGRPCVVTNVSGNPEFIDDEITGFIGGGPTVDDVDAALERSWTNRHRLREIGASAHASIRKKLPRDPVQVFTQRLQDVVHAHHASSTTIAAG
jgi:glycosyltransferase involved in cell wall biosynthesis